MNKIDIKTATFKEIKRSIYEVISEVSGLSVSDLDVDMSIADDIAPNSIDRITLFMALEDEFGESIPESEAKDIHTLEQLVKFVEHRAGQIRNT